jgi:hypothetical protein
MLALALIGTSAGAADAPAAAGAGSDLAHHALVYLDGSSGERGELMVAGYDGAVPRLAGRFTTDARALDPLA